MADIMKQLWVEEGPTEVQDFISRTVRQLTRQIADRWSPQAIIMSGSFGRGEGTVKLLHSRLYCLSDFEISVVRHCPIRTGALLAAADTWSREKEVDIGLYYNPPLKYTMQRAQRLYWRPGFVPVKYYDRCSGARVVWGRDYLANLSPVSVNDIPLWEGLRLIFNRTAQALAHLKVPEDEKERMKQAFWLYRIVISCQDALLIAAQKYTSSYRARNNRLKRDFAALHPDLCEKLPELYEMSEEATDFKLKAGMVCPRTFDDLLDKTQRICKAVSAYLIHHDLGIRWDSTPQMFDDYVHCPKVADTYYRFPSATYQRIVNRFRLRRMSPGASREFTVHHVYMLALLTFLQFHRSQEQSEDGLAFVEERLLSLLGDGIHQETDRDNAVKQTIHALWHTLLT
ncbi:MAG: hypothetical protein K9N51_02985 [Candidatus Pacebacteria bacterium]|nr:hypothetical protein [Candidatus Paceibacterota bacterium]